MSVDIDSSHLRELVATWTAGRGHVVQLRTAGGRQLGNNGDTLMHRVFYGLLQDFGMDLLPDGSARDADYLIVPPNGALLERYQAPQLLTNRLKELPDRPLVIFPSSAQFASKNPAEMFANRKAPTLWVLRERQSYKQLSERWGDSLSKAGVKLALDHDVVISGQHHAKRIMRETAGIESREYSLLVSRLGVEATDMRAVAAAAAPSASTSRLNSLAVASFQRLPQSIGIAIRRRRTLTRQLQANAELCRQLSSDLRAVVDSLPLWQPVVDISDPSLCGFREFARSVMGAGVVATNRLHVAIPATLLGKRVILVDSGYHKLRGVYEQSLQGASNLTFVRRHD